MFTLMSHFKPEKLHIKYSDTKDIDIISRKYTLTHSDFTGELFLTIGRDYDFKKLKQFYVRFMRDEVLAEWKEPKEGYELHIYVHVSGGLVCGGANFRNKIIRSHLPLVLDLMRYVEREIIQNNSALQDAAIVVHFQSRKKKYNKIETVGKIGKV